MTPDAASVPRTLPRGPHRLAREVVLASQRGRMLEAMAEAVAEKGYGPTTVGDVITRAGVSRKTFYEHFTDKEECFLAAYEAGVEVLMTTLHEAGADETDLLARGRIRVRAYLETLAAEPAFARTFLIEVNAAGPRALARRNEVHDRFAALAAELAPGADRTLALAAIGGTQEVVTRWVAEGRIAELPQLEEDVLRITRHLLLARD